MKKLIAIAVVFALIAGTAFAETRVSGLIETRFTAIQGHDQDYHSNALNNSQGFNPRTGGTVGSAYVQLSGQNDEGTVGGLWRLRNQDIVRPAASDNNGEGPWFHRAFVWWRPVPQLRVFLGIDNDGMYSTGDALTDWQFHQGPEDYLAVHDWGFWRGVFPGHWDGFGLSFSVFPVQGLNINLTIPTGRTTWQQATRDAVGNTKFADHVYLAGLKLQASYAFPEIGTLFFAYDGPGAGANDGYYWDGGEAQQKTGAFGLIGASFLVEALRSSGLRFQLGFSTNIVGEDKVDYEPITLGLGLHYVNGDFGVKFRAAAKLGKVAGVDKDKKDVDYNTTFLTANVMPWYKISIMTIYCDIGMSLDANSNEMKLANDNPDSPNGFGWWVTPYFKMPLGGPSLEAGVVIYNNISGTGNVSVANKNLDVKDAFNRTYYRIPLRFIFSF
jgi:hypothetical protein